MVMVCKGSRVRNKITDFRVKIEIGLESLRREDGIKKSMKIWKSIIPRSKRIRMGRTTQGIGSSSRAVLSSRTFCDSGNFCICTVQYGSH